MKIFIKNLPKAYIFFVSITIFIWGFFMMKYGLFSSYLDSWAVPLTMVFGSFIAGATSEGGGAIAFPVFTLFLKIDPAVARNFSFAIQSLGMTAASIFIISSKIKICKNLILITSTGGIIGLLIGIFYLNNLFPPQYLKVFFVTLWLSFGFALFLKNQDSTKGVSNDVDINGTGDVIRILTFGFIGGIITSFFGNGIDIFTFCLFTLYYRLDEKIATPTSVVLMTIHTIMGFLTHVFIVKDFQPITFKYWMLSIPIVIFFAPLGAFLISKISRIKVVNILYTVIVAQFISALLIIDFNEHLRMLTIVVLILGFLFFYILSKYNKKIIK